jgi:Type I restriction enzyme R protein N terminus (HSDR_N)
MQFDPPQINKMSEADVRAEIIDKVIARLGYRFDHTNFVERERTLRYQYGFIGHKSKRDIPLGAADYICGVYGRRGSFTVEAKKGSHIIVLDDVEQAHSYAVLPEVRADYFVVSNGHFFKIYETMRGDPEAPIVSIENSKLVKEFYKIEAILSPEALLKNCNRVYDLDKPLGNKLGSKLIVTGGFVTTDDVKIDIIGDPRSPIIQLLKNSPEFRNIDVQLEELKKLQQTVTSGSLQRGEGERLEAVLKFGSSSPESEHNLLALNLETLTFVSESSTLEPEVPIIFESIGTESVPAGTALFPGVAKELASTPFSVNLHFNFRGFGTLNAGAFAGDYTAYAVFQLRHPFVGMIEFSASYVGRFRVHTAPIS